MSKNKIVYSNEVLELIIKELSNDENSFKITGVNLPLDDGAKNLLKAYYVSVLNIQKTLGGI